MGTNGHWGLMSHILFAIEALRLVLGLFGNNTFDFYSWLTTECRPFDLLYCCNVGNRELNRPIFSWKQYI